VLCKEDVDSDRPLLSASLQGFGNLWIKMKIKTLLNFNQAVIFVAQ